VKGSCDPKAYKKTCCQVFLLAPKPNDLPKQPYSILVRAKGRQPIHASGEE